MGFLALWELPVQCSHADSEIIVAVAMWEYEEAVVVVAEAS